MTLMELRYLVALAETRHFGHAAQACCVSQPTLSIAIKKLEGALGAALCERNRQGVQMTPLGDQVLARARKILEQMAEIEDLTQAAADHLQGPLSLGVLANLGAYLMPQCLPLLQKLAPQMPLYIEEGSASHLGRRLQRGHLDALVVSLPFELADVVVQPLYQEPYDLLLPAGHPMAQQPVIAAESLPVTELLLPGMGYGGHAALLAALPQLQAHQEELRAIPPSASFETLRQMVASGLGVAILPRSAVQAPFYEPDLLVVRPLVAPAPTRTVALAWRASFPRHKAIDVLRQAVQSCSSAYWDYSTLRSDTGRLMVENRDW